MDVKALAQMEPATLRMVLPGYLSGYINNPESARTNRARISALVNEWSDDACRAVVTSLTTGGDGFRVFPANPYCRELSRQWSHDAILEPRVQGIEHLRAAAESGPTVILCNHFSYYDATATDALIAWEGAEDLADRLLYVAGPKVYDHLFRRVAASCLNTVKVPQSVKLSHTSRLSARDLAMQALSSLEATTRALTEDRKMLVLYPEGTRTRDGRMKSFLRGVHRYLSIGGGATVVPTAILGTDKLMGIEQDERIVPSAVGLTFTEPLRVGPDGSAKEVLAKTHARIAAVLPDEHKPHPDTPPLS